MEQSRFLLLLIYSTSKGENYFWMNYTAQNVIIQVYGDRSLGTTVQDEIMEKLHVSSVIFKGYILFILSVLFYCICAERVLLVSTTFNPLSTSSSLVRTNQSHLTFDPQADPWTQLRLLIWNEWLWQASASGFSTQTQGQLSRVACQ